MKRFFLVALLILCLTVPMLFMSGCAKKEEPKTEEPVMEQVEEAPAMVDTVAVEEDTTGM
jgi:outer membrane lipoprotein-sorting protein